jgi:hypothetical protein
VAEIADAWDGAIGFERTENTFSAVLRLKAAGPR